MKLDPAKVSKKFSKAQCILSSNTYNDE